MFKIKNQIYSIVISFLSCFILAGCTTFIYPKIVYRFQDINETPSFAAEKRFTQLEFYDQELDFVFSRPGNSFKSYLKFLIFVDKPYKTLYIDSMLCKSEGEQYTIISETTYQLPEFYSEEDLFNNHYYAKNGYYLTYQMKPIDTNRDSRFVDWHKVFNKKRSGERFKVEIEIRYRFDDENFNTLEFPFRVTSIENHYVSPFMGL